MDSSQWRREELHTHTQYYPVTEALPFSVPSRLSLLLTMSLSLTLSLSLSLSLFSRALFHSLSHFSLS